MEKARHAGSKGRADLRLPMGPSLGAQQGCQPVSSGSDTLRKLYVLSVADTFLVPPEVSDLRPDHRGHLIPLKLYLATNTRSNSVID